MTGAYFFRSPTPILEGAGVAAQVGEHAKALKVARALLVTDPGVARTPHLATVTASLSAAGVPWDVFDRVEPDPSTTLVEASAAEVRTGGYDLFVALGGGSSIDAAKGLRLLCQFGGVLRDYAPGDRVPGPPAFPLIAISTTAGTGSQVSFGAVFSDLQRGTKFAVSSPKIAPTLALNDPLVTMGAPVSVTANAGMDALGHAVESFLSLRANPYADALNLQAVRSVARNLPRVIQNGDDLEAREAMLTASTMATLAGSNTGLGADHAVAMPLCAMFHLPHGLVIGMLLGYVMEYNLEARTDRLAGLAGALGVDVTGKSAREAAEAAVAVVKGLSRTVGQAQRLRDVGVREGQLERIAALTMESFQVANNPRRMSAESVAEMLRKAYE